MPILKFVLRNLYAPLFFLGFIGISLDLIEIAASKFWLLALLALAIAISFLAERIAPFEPNWNLSKGDRRRDWIHAVVNEVSNIFAIALIPLIAALELGFNIWPNDWPLWTQLLFAVLMADFGITMVHYASHKIEFLWRFHAVHHSVERMYGFNGLMKHPLHQTIELMAGTTPLLLLSIPLDIASLLVFAVAIQLLLQHSNVDMRIGKLTMFWAVAPGHRHHHRDSITRGDVNFGLFTMVWDHMLGTFLDCRDQPGDGEIGVFGRPDYPVDYFRQLIEPFRAALPRDKC